MKRVICLYRVSTVGQVDHDDIPMQKLACREYAATHPDWEIVDEISEKGISGYKVSTNDRDAIVEIKKRAIMHKFDVLLVFMFDRIGRRDDETPFVVQWFVQQGIEVWSAREGEQRFDTGGMMRHPSLCSGLFSRASRSGVPEKASSASITMSTSS